MKIVIQESLGMSYVLASALLFGLVASKKNFIQYNLSGICSPFNVYV